MIILVVVAYVAVAFGARWVLLRWIENWGYGTLNLEQKVLCTMLALIWPVGMFGPFLVETCGGRRPWRLAKRKVS